MRTSRAQELKSLTGTGNHLEISPDELFQNVLDIQHRNNLPRSKTIEDGVYGIPNFSVEMETGTGKTYVYTRSMLEMYREYGFCKFIVVVPSVAIRE